MCLAPDEWRAIGYEGSFGNYRKVRETKPGDLYEATSGAYGSPSSRNLPLDVQLELEKTRMKEGTHGSDAGYQRIKKVLEGDEPYIPAHEIHHPE
jgi:hypothetical protein